MNRLSGQAAVMVIVRSGLHGRAVLLTERAAHLSAHPGEVAFPGGKWEEGDVDLWHTALRETHEEVAINPNALHLLGCLPTAYTAGGVAVTPYVTQLKEDVVLVHDPGEINGVFWMPEAELVHDRRVRTDIFRRNGREYWAPAYCYDGYDIWGFTARVLVQFMNRYWQTAIEKHHDAPVFIYEY